MPTWLFQHPFSIAQTFHLLYFLSSLQVVPFWQSTSIHFTKIINQPSASQGSSSHRCEPPEMKCFKAPSAHPWLGWELGGAGEDPIPTFPACEKEENGPKGASSCPQPASNWSKIYKSLRVFAILIIWKKNSMFPQSQWVFQYGFLIWLRCSTKSDPYANFSKSEVHVHFRKCLKPSAFGFWNLKDL